MGHCFYRSTHTHVHIDLLAYDPDPFNHQLHHTRSSVMKAHKKEHSIPSIELLCDVVFLDQRVITSNLSCLPHITSLCNKARKEVGGMIYRRFNQHSDSHNYIYNYYTLLKLYLTIILSHDHISNMHHHAVWDPYHKTEVEPIESVQKFALRMHVSQVMEYRL